MKQQLEGVEGFKKGFQFVYDERDYSKVLFLEFSFKGRGLGVGGQNLFFVLNIWVGIFRGDFCLRIQIGQKGWSLLVGVSIINIVGYVGLVFRFLFCFEVLQ